MEYIRILNDYEIQILSNDLLDIKEWIDKAIDGKIINCKKRTAIQYREQLKSLGIEMVPVNDDDAIQALFARTDYKNRAQRETKE